MIDIINVRCPECGSNFSIDMYTGEEARNSDGVLTRRSSQNINWAEIASEIHNGYANAILSVGDTISFNLKDGRKVRVAVAAIDLYKPNSAVFVFDDICWKEPMNQRATNRGGWANSHMARFLRDEILPLLPDELVGVIKSREIVQTISDEKFNYTGKLWLPSLTEVGAKDFPVAETDDKPFPIFSGERNRTRESNGKTYWWWLRSPNVSGTTTFWYVSNGGGVGSYDASNACGVCPCFII